MSGNTLETRWDSSNEVKKRPTTPQKTEGKSDISKNKEELERRNRELQRLLPSWELKNFLNKKENYKLKSELIKEGLIKIYEIGSQAAGKGLSNVKEITVGNDWFKIVLTDDHWKKSEAFTLKWFSPSLYSKLKDYSDHFWVFLKEKLKEHISYKNKQKGKAPDINKQKNDTIKQNEEELERRNRELQRLLPSWELKNFLNKKENYKLKSELIKEGLVKIYKIGSQAAEKGLSNVKEITVGNDWFNIVLTDDHWKKSEAFTLKWFSPSLYSKLKDYSDHFWVFLKEKLKEHISYKNKQKGKAYYIQKGSEESYKERGPTEKKERGTADKNEIKFKSREQEQEKFEDKKAIESTSLKKKEVLEEISNVSKEEALGTIPKELYEKYIKKFLESPEVKNLGIERDKLLRLINQIDSKTNSDPDFAKLRKVRESNKDIQTMIDENQEKQSDILKEKTEEITLESWKKVFEKLGIKISKGEVKQWNYKFIDANNPNISYYFKVETGEFFISNPELSQQTKTLSLWWERFRKFLKIPGYTELMSQALWHKYLPTERPDTEKELYKTIEKNLRNRIMYTIGDTEVIATKDIIERRQLESTIIAKIKSGLDIRKNTVTATNDLWYYEILAPILRTFQQPNLSIDQLKTLKVFADRISEKGQSNDGKTGSAEDVVSYENFRKEITTPRKLVKYALSWEQTRELANLQWTSKKSKFAIGMFMQWLETSTGAGWKENRVIDTEKLNALLNTRDSPDLANRWKYQSSYNELLTTIETSYLKKVEPAVRKQEVAYADKVILPKIQNTPA